MILMPKEELLPEWKLALRSGKYEQTAGNLKVLWSGGRPRYCCLGLLCELAKFPERLTPHDVVAFGDSTTAMPIELIRHMGFATTVGSFKDPIEWNGLSFGSLSGMNDGRPLHGIYSINLGAPQVPFNEIADVLDRFEDRIFYDPTK